MKHHFARLGGKCACAGTRVSVCFCRMYILVAINLNAIQLFFIVVVINGFPLPLSPLSLGGRVEKRRREASYSLLAAASAMRSPPEWSVRAVTDKDFSRLSAKYARYTRYNMMQQMYAAQCIYAWPSHLFAGSATLRQFPRTASRSSFFTVRSTGSCRPKIGLKRCLVQALLLLDLGASALRHRSGCHFPETQVRSESHCPCSLQSVAHDVCRPRAERPKSASDNCFTGILLRARNALSLASFTSHGVQPTRSVLFEYKAL
jgi:hypothetical protein